MKKASKFRHILSFIFNLATAGLVAFVVLNCFFSWFGTPITNPDYAIVMADLKGTWYRPFMFLPFDLTIAAGVCAFIYMFQDLVLIFTRKNKEAKKWINTLKLLATTAEVMVVVYMFALLPTVLKEPGITEVNWNAICLNYNSSLYVSIVIPALVIISYLFIELTPKTKFRKSLLGIFVGGTYALGASIFFFFRPMRTENEIYFSMFDFAHEKLWIIIAWEIGICLSGLIIAMIILGFRQLNRQIAGFEVKEPNASEVTTDSQEPQFEVVEDEAPVFVEKIDHTQPRPTPTPIGQKKVIIIKSRKPNAKIMKEDFNTMEDRKNEQNVRPDAYKGNARVYHISRQPSGKWQVKLANGERAIKLFDTQAKAIDYAKSLVNTQGGSYRVHSMSGKIRKD